MSKCLCVWAHVYVPIYLSVFLASHFTKALVTKYYWHMNVVNQCATQVLLSGTNDQLDRWTPCGAFSLFLYTSVIDQLGELKCEEHFVLFRLKYVHVFQKKKSLGSNIRLKIVNSYFPNGFAKENYTKLREPLNWTSQINTSIEVAFIYIQGYSKCYNVRDHIDG